MKKNLNIGSNVDDGTGDYLRDGGQKINNNFDELYNELGDGTRPFPSGAWETISASGTAILSASFGKSYAIDTTLASITVNLPKGTAKDYNKVIKLRDVFSTWQINNVTVVPANGDTLKGNSDSQIFSANLTDLEMVYCAPGRWEYLSNKRVNKLSPENAETVIKKEFICTEGQTDFDKVFGESAYNIGNVSVYHRGNLLYYGDGLNDNSDYGSIGKNGELVELDGISIKLRDPADEGDSVIIVTYLDGLTEWRSTYNRLDCSILDKNKTNVEEVYGSQLVVDLSTFKEVPVKNLGYTLSSGSGLINPQTLEVYINGIILNEAGTAGTPMFICDGADADNATDCNILGGTWKNSNTDYSIVNDQNGIIESILFDREFEHGDIITLKWYNNNIGTTLSIDEIVETLDEKYINRGGSINISGDVAVTDYNNPVLPNVEPVSPYTKNIQEPSDIFDIIYPIGTIYENAINQNNPSTYMGFGTWVLWGEKQVIAGWTKDINDTQFGLNNNYKDSLGNATHTAGGTGGNRTVTITEDNVPTLETTEKLLVVDPNGSIIIGGCQFDPSEEGPAYDKFREDTAKINPDNKPPTPLDILPPYITVYRWMRVA